MKEKQYRNFSLVLYCNSAIELISTLCNINNINAYAFILHDKDVNSLSELKENHFHLVLRLKSARSISTVKGYFKFFVDGKLQNVFCQVATDLNACYEYLFHKNNADKYQYNESDIVTNNKFAFVVVETEKDNSLNIINDYLNKVPLRQIVAVYGKEFVYHYKAFKELCAAINMEDSYAESLSRVRDWELIQINDCDML